MSTLILRFGGFLLQAPSVRPVRLVCSLRRLGFGNSTSTPEEERRFFVLNSVFFFDAHTLMARLRRRHPPEVLLLYLGIILSVFRSGIDAFYVGSSGRPFRAAEAATYRATRSVPAPMKAGNEYLGEAPFESIADLEALTVLRLKAELKMRGMKQNGKKADLVRILANEPGVLTQPPPAKPSAEASATEENQADVPQPPAPESPPVPKKTQTSQPSLVVEDALMGIPGGAFASPIAAAVASEAIMDAELAQSPGAGDGETAGLEEEDAVHDLDIEEDDYSSSSSFGDEIEDPEREGQLPTGFHRINQRRPKGARPAMPELPLPTDDMRRQTAILDLMERRETTFEREDDLESGAVQRSDVYTVYTKKALRPWDGPHADRAETNVVVLLSDVFGWGDSFTRSAADQVADVTDAIVLVPDMFRKNPWDNEQPPENYEAWRKSHDPDDVAADIRACVAYARSEYKPTSLGLMGFCYGGGKALEEAAAGVVKPDNLVVFYPTRYNMDRVASGIACPVAAFFAEYDVLPGATVEDARSLREKLLQNENVPDVQVKLCPEAGHGFAHRPMRRDKENAEDAMLLATSWLEMYLQKHFLPVPGGVKETEFGFWELPS